jgi:hypothetical protein
MYFARVMHNKTGMKMNDLLTYSYLLLWSLSHQLMIVSSVFMQGITSNIHCTIVEIHVNSK